MFVILVVNFFCLKYLTKVTFPYPSIMVCSILLQFESGNMKVCVCVCVRERYRERERKIPLFCRQILVAHVHGRFRLQLSPRRFSRTLERRSERCCCSYDLTLYGIVSNTLGFLHSLYGHLTG